MDITQKLVRDGEPLTDRTGTCVTRDPWAIRVHIKIKKHWARITCRNIYYFMIITFFQSLLYMAIRALFSKYMRRQANCYSFQGTKNVRQNISYVRGQQVWGS